MSCRRVCKRWCTAVDTFMESVPLHRKVEDIYFPNFTCFEYHYSAGFEDVTAPKSKWVGMSTHKKNPLIGRAAYLYLPYFIPNYSRDGDSDIQFFLTNFGRYVYSLQIVPRGFQLSKLDYYLILLDVLIYCPNLRNLYVPLPDCPRLVFARDKFDRQGAHAIYEGIRNRLIVHETVEDNKFWQEILQTIGTDALHFEIEEQAGIEMRYSSCTWNHLESLYCSLTPNFGLGANTIRAPNLSNIMIESIPDTVDFSRWMKLILQYPKLQVIDIVSMEIGERRPEGSLDFRELPTEVSGSEIEQIMEVSRVCLPQLTNLSIGFVVKGCFGTLDLLLFFPNVKHLSLHFINHSPVPRLTRVEERFVKMRECLPIWEHFRDGDYEWEREEIYRSNLWQVLDKLESLEIGLVDLPVHAPGARKMRERFCRHKYNLFQEKIARRKKTELVRLGG